MIRIKLIVWNKKGDIENHEVNYRHDSENWKEESREIYKQYPESFKKQLTVYNDKTEIFNHRNF